MNSSIPTIFYSPSSSSSSSSSSPHHVWLFIAVQHFCCSDFYQTITIDNFCLLICWRADAFYTFFLRFCSTFVEFLSVAFFSHFIGFRLYRYTQTYILTYVAVWLCRWLYIYENERKCLDTKFFLFGVVMVVFSSIHSI
jgi:hypothetical protein